jgi:hypothetical protein
MGKGDQMRTTVTLESSDLQKLMKVSKIKTKSKAVAFAVDQALRLQNVKILESLRGKVSIDKNTLKWRHLAR